MTERRDPFTVPSATHDLADAPPRAQVVVDGTVWAVDRVAWTGGPVLDVTLVDGSGRLALVFMGRSQLGGVEPGRRIAAAGTVGTHLGRRVILNPQVWLLPTLANEAGLAAAVAAVADAPHADRQPQLATQTD